VLSTPLPANSPWWRLPAASFPHPADASSNAALKSQRALDLGRASLAETGRRAARRPPGG
jgi:hypothetical protein